MMSEQRLIQDFLEQNGISLKPSGVNNYTLKKADAIALLNIIEGSNVPVLGGDVYLKEAEKYPLTYDNWYLDKAPSETVTDFSRKSILKAREYIENYTNNESVFAFVFGDMT